MLLEQPGADQPYQRDQAESRCPEVGLADITTDEDELFKGRDCVAVDVLRQAEHRYHLFDEDDDTLCEWT